MAEQRTDEDRKHLYLVFDDWKSGYSIRKVNLSRRSGKQHLSSDSSGEDDSDSEQPGLSSGPGKDAKPLPVIMRFSAMRGFPEFFASAFGTKIIAMHARSLDDPGVPTIDVRDLTCSFEVQQINGASPIYLPVSDDRLFALDYCKFEVLQEEHSGQPWEWQTLDRPPFMVWDVSSYGVRYDGCILVSTSTETFIFDIEEFVWKHYGFWVFPFAGRGHYDSSLNGFVGLSKDPETRGCLYCCTMASTVTGDPGKVPPPTKPDLKRTKHTLYSESPAEGQHISATLVHMRPGKFCLVECVAIDDYGGTDQFTVLLGPDEMELRGGGPQGGHFIYRLKTFSLSIMKGDVKLKNSKVCCYRLPHEARMGTIHKDPVAFWL